MQRRNFGLALAFSIFGLVFSYVEFPQAHLVQIIFPFACGLAAGILFGRGLSVPRSAT